MNDRKRIFVIITIFTVIGLIFTTCEGPMGTEGEQGIQGVQGEIVLVTGFDNQLKSIYYVEKGEKLYLRLNVTPMNATIQSIIWTSSNPAVVGIKSTERVNPRSIMAVTGPSTEIEAETKSAGTSIIFATALGSGGIEITTKITINVFGTLPVIRINTDNNVSILDRETWVSMTFSLNDPENQENNISSISNQQIRGRGNTTWSYPKKPYRIRFRNNTSMFGLAAARDWVLLANHKDATMITNTVAFELGQRFNGQLFENNYAHVEVVLNGEYLGSYLLTEHMRVGVGRVDIDPVTDYLVELDVYYDEDPKFKTNILNLPVMIKSPDFGTDINNAEYQFIIDSLNMFDVALSDSNFPNNNWKDLVDLDSFVDFIMINEIVRNTELNHPKSTYLCSINGIIQMSHLWDFDWAFGLGGNTSVNVSTAGNRYRGGSFFSRLFLDSEFSARYKARWIEKYDEISTMPIFIENMYNKLQLSADLNGRRWYTYNFRDEIDKLKTWWDHRVNFLDSAIRGE